MVYIFNILYINILFYIILTEKDWQKKQEIMKDKI